MSKVLFFKRDYTSNKHRTEYIMLLPEQTEYRCISVDDSDGRVIAHDGKYMIYWSDDDNALVIGFTPSTSTVRHNYTYDTLKSIGIEEYLLVAGVL